jgi:hypothetical protein
MKPAAALLALFATVSVACGRNDPASDLIEVQRARSGDVDVILLSNDGVLTHGKDTFIIEFRRGDRLVDVGMVKAGATMPMAGMSPMMGSVFLEPGDMPGRYTADTDLSMSGGWTLKLEWNGPAGKGSASFQATVE